MNGQTNGRKISPFYRTLSLIGAAALLPPMKTKEKEEQGKGTADHLMPLGYLSKNWIHLGTGASLHPSHHQQALVEEIDSLIFRLRRRPRRSRRWEWRLIRSRCGNDGGQGGGGSDGGQGGGSGGERSGGGVVKKFTCVMK